MWLSDERFCGFISAGFGHFLGFADNNKNVLEMLPSNTVCLLSATVWTAVTSEEGGIHVSVPASVKQKARDSFVLQIYNLSSVIQIYTLYNK